MEWDIRQYHVIVSTCESVHKIDRYLDMLVVSLGVKLETSGKDMSTNATVYKVDLRVA